LIVMAYPMGTASAHFQPRGSATDFTLPTVSSPLEPFRDRCLFVSNLDNAVMSLNRNHAFGHPAKKQGVLTGTLLRGAFSGDRSNRIDNVMDSGPAEGGPNGPSVCHFVGSRLGSRSFPSVDLGIHGRGDQSPSQFFFEGAENPVTMWGQPQQAFDHYFAGLTGSTGGEPDPRRQRSASVLDAVRQSFRELEGGLSRDEQRRLRDHAERIRQLEQDVARAACEAPTGLPSPWASPRVPMAQAAPLMNEVLANAVGCDLAPVGRIEYLEQHDPVFGVPSVDDAVRAWKDIDAGGGNWHAMVHGDVDPTTGNPTRPSDGSAEGHAPYLLDGYRFFVEQYADLLGRLDSIPEGDAGLSALDHSLVVLASDFGDGRGHSSNKMSFVLAGNTGPTGRLGYHFDAAPGRGFYSASDYNVNHLLTSIAQMFEMEASGGGPVQQFGLRGFAEGRIDALFRG
jgi:hypothetical protein